RRIEKDLQCPQCDKLYDNVVGLTKHLRHIHDTTPFKAGIVFRCACGKETVSNNHAYKCDQASSAVIIPVQESINYKE
ncbi:hypothetical protein PFISCL1PPCAC_23074, partial [Pristionchus fissidentatus]